MPGGHSNHCGYKTPERPADLVSDREGIRQQLTLKKGAQPPRITRDHPGSPRVARRSPGSRDLKAALTRGPMGDEAGARFLSWQDLLPRGLGLYLRHDRGELLNLQNRTTMAKAVSDSSFENCKSLAKMLTIFYSQILYKHYQRILNQWPVDLLRPEVSFQKTLQKRMDNRLKPSTTPPEHNVVSNEAQATVPTAVPFDEKGELEQVNVLYSFLENRYTKKVDLPDATCRDRLMQGY